MAQERISEMKKGNVRKPAELDSEKTQKPKKQGMVGLDALQQTVGNRAIQRLLAQRSDDGPYELDDETANSINSERGRGENLNTSVQAEMQDSFGYDFSNVNVHSSSESGSLNEQLGSKAFTTGQDIFFNQGAFEPNSSSGKELLAHELTHVVQQGTGQVKGGSGMTVNEPGDEFEIEADTTASELDGREERDNVQMQEEEELEDVQMQEEEELEDVQMQEDEEDVQLQPMEEEEEMVQP
ncbi:MAG: DUF4157 domain-containing protein [Anaerolineaceae bacterium]|nr:DUF4157 domain-containing protein [Anaerolineaceae bacterium]